MVEYVGMIYDTHRREQTLFFERSGCGTGPVVYKIVRKGYSIVFAKKSQNTAMPGE